MEFNTAYRADKVSPKDLAQQVFVNLGFSEYSATYAFVMRNVGVGTFRHVISRNLPDAGFRY